MAIPAWNASGLLPPYLAGPALPTGRAPFDASMSEVVSQFGSSPHRKRLLRGLLSYRSQLVEVGLTAGFQLLNGSFVEDCERGRMAPPSDIDVVTFAYFPKRTDEKRRVLTGRPLLFNFVHTKSVYHCDAYVMDLGADPHIVCRDMMYWFGLFSHQKITDTWKGLLSIDLASDDQAANALLVGD